MRVYLGAALGIGGVLLAALAWAGDGKSGCPSQQATAQGKVARTKAKAGCCAAGAKATLTKIDAYQRADELLAAWSKAPAKLAALTEADKKATQELGQKMMTQHPAAEHFMPAMAFLNDAMATAVALDDATKAACGAQCGDKKASASGCPKKAAFKARIVQRAALTAKANELMLAAGTAMGKAEGCDKSACSKAQKSARTVAAVGGDKPAGCCKSKKAAAATVASATGCDKSNKAACSKALVAKAEDLVKQSAVLAAGWRGTNATLAAMDASDRASADQLLASAQAACPIGSLMPGTLNTVKALLAEADKLDAACSVECRKNARLAESIPAEIKKLQNARRTLCCAILNLMDQMDVVSTPTKELARAN